MEKVINVWNTKVLNTKVLNTKKKGKEEVLNAKEKGQDEVFNDEVFTEEVLSEVLSEEVLSEVLSEEVLSEEVGSEEVGSEEVVSEEVVSKNDDDEVTSVVNAITAALAAHPRVRWVQLEVPQERTTRTVTVNDPSFAAQWHLRNLATGNDVAVEAAWEAGVTGAGVTVAVVDDGVDYTSADLAAAYRADGSYDVQGSDANPMPEDGDTHGTRCSSEIVAAANNSYCGVGIAYGARLSGACECSALPQKPASRSAPDLVFVDLGSQQSACWGCAPTRTRTRRRL